MLALWLYDRLACAPVDSFLSCKKKKGRAVPEWHLVRLCLVAVLLAVRHIGSRNPQTDRLYGKSRKR